MYKIVGIKSGDIYAQGTKPECMRAINENYPYATSKKKSVFSTVDATKTDAVFTEPMRVIRRHHIE